MPPAGRHTQPVSFRPVAGRASWGKPRTSNPTSAHWKVKGRERGRSSFPEKELRPLSLPDRFGRVVDQRWLTTATGTATDRFQYGYDRDSNRLYRDNLLNSLFGELYSYDNLGQITSFDRGTLNSSKNGIDGMPSRSQTWNLDSVGNWSSVTTDGSTQTRTANAQNEITSVSGATTPTYDANGNLTTDESARQLVYDAWNRLAAVKDSGGSTIVSYQYDGQDWRISETKGGVTRDLYFSSAWQVLEERVGGQAQVQYVWSPVYVDALVLRDRDTDANGSLEERLRVQQDANFNMTALLDNSGNVVERFAYEPFGQATVYDASWNVRTGGSAYGWVHLHQGLRYDKDIGLYDDRGRAYSPTLGRFVSVDPRGFAAGDVDLYRYEGNNSVNRVDPLGREPKGYAHAYPLFIGGDPYQERYFLSKKDHTAFHDYLRDNGWQEKPGISNDTIRDKWKTLAPEKRKEVIKGAMEAGRIPQKFIDQHLDELMFHSHGTAGDNLSTTEMRNKTPRKLYGPEKMKAARAAETLQKAKGRALKILGKIPGIGLLITLFTFGEKAKAEGCGTAVVDTLTDQFTPTAIAKLLYDLFDALTGESLSSDSDSEPPPAGQSRQGPGNLTVVPPSAVPPPLPVYPPMTPSQPRGLFPAPGQWSSPWLRPPRP
jgi:RHS repeat-associated protein